nr:histone lysine N methyltransferase SETMAR [Hymenolepis microstoma]
MKNSVDRLRLTGLSQILMVKRLAISDITCRREWFQRFKSGDFAVKDRHNGGGRNLLKMQNWRRAILSEDSCQAQEELSESLGISMQAISKRMKQLGMFKKEGKLKP